MKKKTNPVESVTKTERNPSKRQCFAEESLFEKHLNVKLTFIFNLKMLKPVSDIILMGG